MRAQIIVVAVFGATAVALGACSGPTPPTPPSPASQVVTITLAADSLVSDSLSLIAGGDTARLKAQALDAQGNPVAGVSFVWSSSDTTAATVSDSGLVTAVGLGSATITVTVTDASSNERDASERSVGPEFALRAGRRASRGVQEISVPHVQINPTSATIGVGESRTFTAVALDKHGNQPWGPGSVTWRSSNSKVAVIGANGSPSTAVGQSPGTTTINATVFLNSGSALGPYPARKPATLTVTACGGIMNVPAWSVDDINTVFNPAPLTANGATWTANEQTDALSGTLSRLPQSGTDSAAWTGTVTGYAVVNSSSVQKGPPVKTSTDMTDGNAPLNGGSNVQLMIKRSSNACLYILTYEASFPYTFTKTDGTTTALSGLVLASITGTITPPATPGAWPTLRGNARYAAYPVVPLTPGYYVPGTDLAQIVADEEGANATVSWALHVGQ